MRPRAAAALRAGLQVFCAYEFVALSTGLVPTVSALVQRASTRPVPRWALRAAWTAIAVGMYPHFWPAGRQGLKGDGVPSGAAARS